MLSLLMLILLTTMKVIALTAITCFTLFGVVYLFSSPARRVILWDKFKAVTHRIGLFNTWIILSLFYVFVITPYALVMALFSDPMRMKKPYSWIKRTTHDLTLEDARRQF